jgi:hypothetical protein
MIYWMKTGILHSPMRTALTTPSISHMAYHCASDSIEASRTSRRCHQADGEDPGPEDSVSMGQVAVANGALTTTAVSSAQEQINYVDQAASDILAYLQNETEFTRSTLLRILKASGIAH